MKYPRLKDKDNLSKKLTDTEITQLQRDFQTELANNVLSATAIRDKLSHHYHVSYATVYYWTNDKYREKKRKANVDYWTEMKTKDYDKWYRHKKQEINNRKNRMERNPDLKLWHATISAKNEKRSKRHTVNGKPLKDYDDDNK